MSDDFKFHVYEVLSNEPIGRLDPAAWSFNDPVEGAGSMEMTIAIPSGKDVTSLKRKTAPDKVQCLVTLGNRIMFGGPINFRTRTPGSQYLTVKVQHWKAWYYTRLFNTRRIYKGDERAIARSLMSFAISDKGTPRLSWAVKDVGKQRELTVEPWWSVGEAMDKMQARDDCYEWSIGLRFNSQTGLPEQFLELWDQGQSRAAPSLLFLDHTQSTNKIAIGEMPEDATERRPRVWATGDEDEAGKQPVAKDEDPALADGDVLLRESVTSWSGVTNPATLFDHARRERMQRNEPMTTLPVDHPYDQPKVTDYRSGDRARLRIKDAWDDLDIPGVRIIDRAISKQQGGYPTATVLLDLLDINEAIDEE